jgi:lipoyl(octanoyl) transferase
LNKNTQVIVKDLGLMDYKACWDYQEVLFNEIVAQKINNRNLSETEQHPTKNYLLLVEHPHVYTLGKSGNENNLLVNEFQLKEKEATYYKINRGGDITYHGPGQLVVYPILDLDNFFTDIHKYLRLLEEAVILTLNEYSIIGERSEGETGVWIEPKELNKARKICAMGVKCSRWVTMHGLALNVNANLSYFNNIVPCGIVNKSVTSIQNELGNEQNITSVKNKIKKHFANLFNATLVN